jgi:hypothetical protein
MSNRRLLVGEFDASLPDYGKMYALDPAGMSTLAIPAFRSGPTLPRLGTVAGEAFLATNSKIAYVWDGAQWNSIVPNAITTYPTDAAIVADTAALAGTYAFSAATGNFFVRFTQGTSTVWRQIGIRVYASQATLIADTPADGSVAMANDTGLYFHRLGGAWKPQSTWFATEAVITASTNQIAGQTAYATDTNRRWNWTGTVWLGEPFRTYATQVALLADATATVGSVGVALDTSAVYVKGATAWVGANNAPTLAQYNALEARVAVLETLLAGVSRGGNGSFHFNNDIAVDGSHTVWAHEFTMN